jgi:hypothetical protein
MDIFIIKPDRLAGEILQQTRTTIIEAQKLLRAALKIAAECRRGTNLQIKQAEVWSFGKGANM